jgi:heme-degrading monooxygenase HmoA
VPIEKCDAYLELMRTVGLADYEKTPGNLEAHVLRRIEGDVAHFIMLTFWESFDAIRSFAGEPIETAKYYDFDGDYLIELEPNVQHYEVFD